MGTTWHRQRFLRSLVLAALLLVPLLASGHAHATHPATPCATCALVQHAPALGPSSPAVTAVTPLVVGIEPLAAAPCGGPAVGEATGRGPPRHARSQRA